MSRFFFFFFLGGGGGGRGGWVCLIFLYFMVGVNSGCMKKN